jgi:hypothetical protein
MRTASYAEAQRNGYNTAVDRPDTGSGATYQGASKKSQAFFKKMGESHAEAARLRQQCRSAANQSSARKEEVKVNLQAPGFEQEIVRHAREVAGFATGATLKAVADCKDAIRLHESSRNELQLLEQAQTQATSKQFADVAGSLAIEQPLDSSAAKQAESQARQRVQEERSKLGQAGLDSLWEMTKEAPHGRFLKLEHLSLPRDLKKKWQEQEEVQAASALSTHRSQESYSVIPEVAKGQHATEVMQVMQALESNQEVQGSPNSPQQSGTKRPEDASSLEAEKPLLAARSEAAQGLEIDVPDNQMAFENFGIAPDISQEASADVENALEKCKPKTDSDSSDDDSDFDESEESDLWPPSPPVLRFKMRMMFSNRFKPANKEEKEMFEEMNRDLEDKFVKEHTTGTISMKDPVFGWLNLVFQMKIETEYQFEVGFPIILLTMMDAIYPKRVRWREVDWRFQYKRALHKNFSVLESIWSEVSMEKAREFRVENTPLRLENLPSASLNEKMEFLRLMKRWYDQRIHHSGPYDPMAKRNEYVDQCKSWGRNVKFPPWIKHDKDHKADKEDSSEDMKRYEKMPEFKRLIWFLGCHEYQTM